MKARTLALSLCATLAIAACGDDESSDESGTTTAAELTKPEVKLSGFDASWDRGEPFTFQLGAGQVIPGWDEGVEGMQVGARRELIIPPKLAYGRQGQPPAIGPDATLVFVIDLLAVE